MYLHPMYVLKYNSMTKAFYAKIIFVFLLTWNSVLGQQMGEVELYDVKLKEQPNWMLDNNTISLLQRGDQVQILSQRDSWYRVKTEQVSGWIYEGSVRPLEYYPALTRGTENCTDSKNSLFLIDDWENRFLLTSNLDNIECDLVKFGMDDWSASSKLSSQEVLVLFDDLIPGDYEDTNNWYFLSRQDKLLTKEGNIEITLIHQTWGNEVYYVTLNKCGEILNVYNIASCLSDGGDILVRETKLVNNIVFSKVRLEFDNAGVFKNILELYEVSDTGRFNMVHYEDIEK